MKMRLISCDGSMCLMFQNRDCFVVDGENFEDMNNMCVFLFSSKINMEESAAKDKLFLFVLDTRLAHVFVLSKGVYKNCLNLIKSELDKDSCILYYEDNIVFRYTNISIGG